MSMSLSSEVRHAEAQPEPAHPDRSIKPHSGRKARRAGRARGLRCEMIWKKPSKSAWRQAYAPSRRSRRPRRTSTSTCGHGRRANECSSSGERCCRAHSTFTSKHFSPEHASHRAPQHRTSRRRAAGATIRRTGAESRAEAEPQPATAQPEPAAQHFSRLHALSAESASSCVPNTRTTTTKEADTLSSARRHTTHRLWNRMIHAQRGNTTPRPPEIATQRFSRTHTPPAGIEGTHNADLVAGARRHTTHRLWNRMIHAQRGQVPRGRRAVPMSDDSPRLPVRRRHPRAGHGLRH